MTPARAWNYTIGGYQLIKKWLSYREHKLIGRPLTTDEAREVMNIARRIASILLLWRLRAGLNKLDRDLILPTQRKQYESSLEGRINYVMRIDREKGELLKSRFDELKLIQPRCR